MASEPLRSPCATVAQDGHWLERMVSQEGRRQREQSDEEEEAIVQPDERPIRALHDLEPNVMADPEDAQGDEAERVRQDRGQDVLGLGELLLRRARDVGNRQAQPEDRHDGPEDAVREGLDPRLSESGDGATSRAHEAYRAIVTVGYKFGLCQERPIPSSASDEPTS